MSCDASLYGVGAVRRPLPLAGGWVGATYRICFQIPLPSRPRYSQLDKEGLAIVYGVKRFHQFLFGWPFTIYTDHKPLIYLFDESCLIPPQASARVQRWALTLSAYEYTVKYKPGKDHANADVFSRLPLPEKPENTPLPGETVLLLELLRTTPVTASQIRTWTSRDPTLARVREQVQQGWTLTTGDEHLRRKDELSVQDGCILWANRVIVPPPGRPAVMEELHDGHPGICRMKGLARRHVWWPAMDTDLEAKVKNCAMCQSHQKAPAQAPLHPWEWPKRPCARVHADYAGPFMGKMFLILVDAHSKWLDIHIVNSATSSSTIKKMRSTFATHGLPEMLVFRQWHCLYKQ